MHSSWRVLPSTAGLPPLPPPRVSRGCGQSTQRGSLKASPTRLHSGKPASGQCKAVEPVGQCCSTGEALQQDPLAAPPATQQQQAASWWDAALSPFRRSPYDSAIFSLALPAVIALAADPLLSIVDTVFVGRAGAESLAALGVNSALFTMSFVVFNFLATATTPLVAAALAQGEKDKAGKVTVQAMLLATVLGSGLAVGLLWGAEGALALMGAGPETGTMHQLAKDFLLVRALASPAVLVATVGQGVFRGLQDMRTPLSITLAANAINLVLDTVLILGLGWGVTGAAAATSTAEWVAAAAYLGLLWRRRDALGGLSVRSVLGAGAEQALQEFGPFLRAGGAVLMRTAVLLGTKTLASATAARLGAVPIASHQVVSQLWLLSSLVIDSVAVAGQTLVAVELGRGDKYAARAVSDRLMQLGLGLGLALAAAFWAGEPWIPGIFSSDPAVGASVLTILPLAVAMVPVNAAVYVLDGVLVGASDFKFMAGAMVVAAATATGLLLGVEPLGLGLEGVWGALALLMASRLGTLLWRYQDPQGPLPPQRRLPAAEVAAVAVEGLPAEAPPPRAAGGKPAAVVATASAQQEQQQQQGQQEAGSVVLPAGTAAAAGAELREKPEGDGVAAVLGGADAASSGSRPSGRDSYGARLARRQQQRQRAPQHGRGHNHRPARPQLASTAAAAGAGQAARMKNNAVPAKGARCAVGSGAEE